MLTTVLELELHLLLGRHDRLDSHGLGQGFRRAPHKPKERSEKEKCEISQGSTPIYKGLAAHG